MKLVFEGTQVVRPKEVIVDFGKILQGDKKAYQDAGLKSWADNLLKANQLVKAFKKPKIRQIVADRLAKGEIPIFMPPAQVQLATMMDAIKGLKPVWIVDGKKQEVKSAYDWDYFKELFSRQDLSLVQGIPDAPHLIFCGITPEPPQETISKTLAEQKAWLQKIKKENPGLNLGAISPTESLALQNRHTGRLYEQGEANIVPLDKIYWTRFINLPVSSVGDVPSGDWNSGGRRLGLYGCGLDAASRGGFRFSVRIF